MDVNVGLVPLRSVRSGDSNSATHSGTSMMRFLSGSRTSAIGSSPRWTASIWSRSICRNSAMPWSDAPRCSRPRSKIAPWVSHAIVSWLGKVSIVYSPLGPVRRTSPSRSASASHRPRSTYDARPADLGVGVVDGYPPVDRMPGALADAQHVREDERVSASALLPEPGAAVLVVPAFQQAELEGLEPEALDGPVVVLTALQPLGLHRVAVEEVRVRDVRRVLFRLQPVAREGLLAAQRPDAALPDQDVPSGKQRLALGRPQIGEQDAGQLLDRVRGVAKGVLEHRLRWLEG